MSDLVHIMVDLETLGTVPGCVIFSIGAVVFDPTAGTLGDEFITVIDVESCEDHYLFSDPATEEWWAKQSAEARKTLELAQSGNAPSLPKALNDFNSWLQRQGNKSRLRIYGNGADFDNPLLRSAYHAARIDPFVGGYGGRCYRTLKNLDELFGVSHRAHKLERTGTHHDALDDAKNQARHLMEIIARIRGNIKEQEA